MENINRQQLCIYQQEELTESDYTNQKRQQTFRV
jgi:hypothetical protein